MQSGTNLETPNAKKVYFGFCLEQRPELTLLISDVLGISGSKSPMLKQYKPATGSSVLREIFPVAGAHGEFLSALYFWI